MPAVLLNIDIIDGPVIIVCFVLAAVALVYLLGKRRTASWFFAAVVWLLLGSFIGYAVVWLATGPLGLVGGPVDSASYLWIPAACAGVALAVANLWGSRWWRKVIAVVSAGLFVLTATLAVNAAYGLQATLGELLHINTTAEIALPPLTEDTTALPLWETWEAPAELPVEGRYGVVSPGIPNTASGFPARPAEVYLPPAALVADPPDLPVVVMMMGQPGDPDARFIAEVLDEFAARHAGLAPIAVVVDQLGDPSADPLCLDTVRGDAESYLMLDVLPWARANLNALDGAPHWTIAGYSNGGQCAASLGSRFPGDFGNILALSPEEYPGVSEGEGIVREVFGGSRLAYEAVWPVNIMAAGAPYADTVAVFTVGDRDPLLAGVTRLADAALAAGILTTFAEVDDAEHDRRALVEGLRLGFEVLYPRLGLEKPPEESEDGTDSETSTASETSIRKDES